MGLEAAAAAGVKVVVTVNSDTLELDFAEASLVVGSLGEPGAPTRVLKGELMGHRWVSIEALQHLCDGPHDSTQERAA